MRAIAMENIELCTYLYLRTSLQAIRLVQVLNERKNQIGRDYNCKIQKSNVNLNSSSGMIHYSQEISQNNANPKSLS